MSHVTFDVQWNEAMHELSKVLQLDISQDAILAPKGLPEYSCLYVKYLQVYKRLEECHDQIIHAQKHLDLRKTLEACIG
eukprot:c42047_g1_i1 orf=1-234(-)